MTHPRVDIGVLGTSTLTVGDRCTPLSAHRMRSLLAVLVLGHGRPIPVENIIDAVWSGRPSPSARNTLQGYVARMRRLLDPQRQPHADWKYLQLGPAGYQLTLPADQIDVSRFDNVVTVVQEQLSTLPDLTRPALSADMESHDRAQAAVLDALTLWRGDPFHDLGDHPLAAGERRRLEEARLDAQTAVAVLDLTMGRARSAAVALEELVAACPLREQLWRLWAVALVRCDRQAHALDVLTRLRTTLAVELGIDPSPAARRLQLDILRQDPSILGTQPMMVGRTLKDRDQPMAAPGPVSKHATRFAPNRLPLIGRERELLALKNAVRATVDGGVGHCEVVGDAGMGKSRLIADVVGWVREHHLAIVTSVRNPSAGQAVPLAELVRALTSLADRSGVPLPPQSLLSPSLAATDLCPGAEAISDFLRKACAIAPVLLVVEDAQWADTATLEILGYVAERLIDVPLMLVVSRRLGGGSSAGDALTVSMMRSGGVVLQLRELLRAEVELLATTVSDCILSEAEIDALHQRTGGNPQYVVEILRDGRPVDNRLPPSLAAMIRRRVEVLPPLTSVALQVAAVMGRQFSADVVLAYGSAEGTDVAEGLESARAAGVVHHRSDGSWEFSSDVVHDALLGSIPPFDLSGLHARVAEAMHATQVGLESRAAVLLHWRNAGEQYTGRAWRSLTTAAARARVLLRYADEAELLGDALDFHRLDPDGTAAERYWMLLRRISACRLAFDPDGASAMAQEAIATAEALGRPDLAAQAATLMADQLAGHPPTNVPELVHGPTARRLLLLAAIQTFLVASDGDIDELMEQALSVLPGHRRMSMAQMTRTAPPLRTAT
ncbi:BTAD domain-containing putative transcriptional regulator [Nocardioides hankookensis]|uniref:BTAD domain-containing putative transcriptional regulator n=1 Tax=Nocardioides hankookensis TaxID=443157 RepID=A0ABW1LGW2_9ACTN